VAILDANVSLSGLTTAGHMKMSAPQRDLVFVCVLGVLQVKVAISAQILKLCVTQMDTAILLHINIVLKVFSMYMRKLTVVHVEWIKETKCRRLQGSVHS